MAAEPQTQNDARSNGAETAMATGDGLQARADHTASIAEDAAPPQQEQSAPNGPEAQTAQQADESKADNAAAAGQGTTDSATAATATTATTDGGQKTAKKATEPELNEEEARETVEEFEYLLEKSQQLFTGLKDLPEIGSKYWLPHFQRTFEVYTKLWKFQGQHRLLLEKPEYYGLKRWEVGEIASKIGQLYYRYYLRTSETNYLHEAYAFYDAIRERSYFKDEQEVKNSALMIKKLRYYARFIVVCLQLNYTPMMLQLLEEVKDLIDVYSTTFNPVDKLEWSLVVKEMALFMQAVCSPVPTDANRIPLPVSYRLVSRRRPRLDKDSPKFRLQEAVIVGNRPTQIKFSELTLDMHYMLQMLEREPSVNSKDIPATLVTSGAATATGTTETATAAATTAEASSVGISESLVTAAMDDTSSNQQKSAEKPDQSSSAQLTNSEQPQLAAASAAAAAALASASVPNDKEKEKDKDDDKEKEKDKEKSTKRINPHKYLLYQPSFGQIQVYLANAFKEIGDQGCVLLYLSSEGAATAPSESQEAAEAAKHGFAGGVSTTWRASAESGKDRNVEQLINTVHPVDLLPYTRKPFFLVVESESSLAYKSMPNLFSQSLLCLLSPTEYPISNSNRGSLYTFFLHSPMLAFCAISSIRTMAADKWSELEELFNELEDLAFELLNTFVTSAGVRKFLSDDFLRQLMVRHVICCAVLDLHFDFSQPQHMPSSSPDFSSEITSSAVLIRKIRDIADFCAVDQLFRMQDPPRSPTAERPAPPAATAEDNVDHVTK
ncbi:hypothetical protein GGI12_000225 [Dipsacomyces acuminosporus]|nr:hypothetical protein GGI12_000225 [Dipsacomyces acuminosporus]